MRDDEFPDPLTPLPLLRLWVRDVARAVARALRPQRRPLGLLAWGRRYLPHYFRRPPSRMHEWLAEQLDSLATNRGAKVNAIGPRGGAKSTVGTLAGVLRAALEGSEPYIWIISDTRRQAHAHLECVCAELAENRRLQSAYGPAARLARPARAGTIRLENGCVIEAFGTGQRVRGRRQRAHRPTLIVCDDLQNDGHIESAAAREKSQRWFDGMLLKAGSKDTNIVNVATALHHDALALVLARTPGWTSRIFAAIARWPDNVEPWQEWETIYCSQPRLPLPAGEETMRGAARRFYDQHRTEMDAGAILLWPEEEDLYTLMCMRVEGGRTAFAREKQGLPLNPELCEWPEDYFTGGIWFDRWPEDLQAKVVALDPSKGGDARRGDYSAFVLLGVGPDGVLYVEADLARRPTPQIVADGVELCRRFRPDAIGVESTAFQELLVDELTAAFAQAGLALPPPWTLDNRVNKRVRIRRLGPYLSGRRMRFREGSPGTRLLIQQLRDFPSGDHDDGPDALEMALRLAGVLLGSRDAGDGLGDRLWIHE